MTQEIYRIHNALRAIADRYTPEVCAAAPKPDGLTVRHAANLLRGYAAAIEADHGAVAIYAAKIRGVRWSTLDSDAARLWGEAVALFGPDQDAARRMAEPMPVLGSGPGSAAMRNQIKIDPGEKPAAHPRAIEGLTLGPSVRKAGPPEWLEHLVTGAYRQGFAAGVAAEQARSAGTVLPSPPCPLPDDPSSTVSATPQPNGSSSSPAP